VTMAMDRETIVIIICVLQVAVYLMGGLRG
jgi:hypothetical protein